MFFLSLDRKTTITFAHLVDCFCILSGTKIPIPITFRLCPKYGPDVTLNQKHTGKIEAVRCYLSLTTFDPLPREVLIVFRHGQHSVVIGVNAGVFAQQQWC
jgi:hypothetical protein